MASVIVVERQLHMVNSQGNAHGSQQRPKENLEMEDDQDGGDEEGLTYPSGPKLWSTMASLCIVCYLGGLDLTIVAVTVPSLTDKFQTIEDIGWYSAAYGMTMSAFVFVFGQIYTLFCIKTIFLIGIAIFEFGSLICTVAPTSAVFILGRATTGLGRGAINGGMLKLLRHCFPLSKQALANSILGAVQSAGLISAPTVGGFLIDAFSWRACFGVNLPLGVICFVLTSYGVHDPVTNPDQALTPKEKIIRINLLGYYYPFMLVTSVLTPIASGLLTTLDLGEQIGKAAGLLVFLGFAVGLGLQGPQIAVQTVLSIDDISVGGAIINFGSGMGSSLWMCALATQFQSRLADEIQSASPGSNVTAVQEAGLSELRESMGPARLERVLAGYENAVVQTLYIPLALALHTIVGSIAMERKSLKKRSNLEGFYLFQRETTERPSSMYFLFCKMVPCIFARHGALAMLVISYEKVYPGV